MNRMNRYKAGQAAFLSALLAALTLALRDPRIPLGVRGEWEWLRVSLPTDPAYLAVAATAVSAHAALAWIGAKDLMRIPAKSPFSLREALRILVLFVSTVAAQTLVMSAAADGHGLDKWAIALHNPGSSGYYLVAKRSAADLKTFLFEYPRWIKKQDSLHIGTHPPGLIVIAAGTRRLLEANPGLRNAILDHMPNSTARAFRALDGVPNLKPWERLEATDRAALALIGGLTLVICSATVAPLYLAVRARGSAWEAWSASAVWGLIPAAVLFQPIADTAFPFLSTTAVALSARPRGFLAPALAGIVLAVGMQLSLVFLPVGLVVALVIATAPETTRSRKIGFIVATGIGFLAFTAAVRIGTGADPFAIWIENLKHHAHFYVEFPRTYRKWLAVAPLETVVAVGLPVSWAIARSVVFRKATSLFWAGFAVVALLHLSGRNLGETARLWLPFYPLSLTPIALGLDRREPKPADLFAIAFFNGIQTLIMQSSIQVVYPDWEKYRI